MMKHLSRFFSKTSCLKIYDFPFLNELTDEEFDAVRKRIRMNQIDLPEDKHFETLIRLVVKPDYVPYIVNLNTVPMPIGALADRLGVSVEECYRVVSEISDKCGILYCYENIIDGEIDRMIMMTEFIGGWYEPSLLPYIRNDEGKYTKEQVRDISRLYHHYHQESMIGAMTKLNPKRFRGAPLEIDNVPDHKIMDYEHIKGVIENANDYAVITCVCKIMLTTSQDKSLEEIGVLEDPTLKGKDIPMKCCMALNEFAAASVKLGLGDRKTKEEMLELLKVLRDQGHCHAPNNTKNPMFICNCHRAFCTLLRANKRFGNEVNPIETSQFIAKFGSDECCACGICMNKCVLQVIYINVEGKAQIGEGRECIGCGVCAHHCPKSAIEMVKRENPPLIVEDHLEEIIHQSFNAGNLHRLAFDDVSSGIQSKLRYIVGKIEKNKIARKLILGNENIKNMLLKKIYNMSVDSDPIMKERKELEKLKKKDME